MIAHHIVHGVDADGIATLTIDQAEKRNAMTWAMLQAFNARIAGWCPTWGLVLKDRSWMWRNI